MTTKEYLQQAKDRALRETDMGGMWASFYKDMNEHPELKDHIALPLGMSLMFYGHWKTDSDCIKFIQGFQMG